MAGFIRRMLSNSSSSSEKEKYCLSEVCCFDGELSLKAVDLEMPFPDERHKVVGYCNGLFCLEYGDGKIVVWKPSDDIDTSSLEVVPYPSNLVPPISGCYTDDRWTYTRHSITVVCGFGQDINTHDYKVVTLVNTYFDVGGDRDDYIKQFYVYTLGNDNGSWEHISYKESVDIEDLDVAGVIDSSGTWANGCCYWITETGYGHDLTQKVLILSLDLATLEFSIIQLPYVTSMSPMGSNFILMESKGALDLIMYKQTNPGSISTWVLNAGCREWECKIRHFQLGFNVDKPLGYLGDRFILEGLDEDFDQSHLLIYDYANEKTVRKSDLIVGHRRSMQLFLIN